MTRRKNSTWKGRKVDGSTAAQVSNAQERIMPGVNERAQRTQGMVPAANRFVGHKGTLHKVSKTPPGGGRSRTWAEATAVAAGYAWYPGAVVAGQDARFFLWFTPEKK